MVIKTDTWMDIDTLLVDGMQQNDMIKPFLLLIQLQLMYLITF